MVPYTIAGIDLTGAGPLRAPRAAPQHGATRLPPMNAILAFEAAARLGSFERASDELALSASAVGKRIRVLEEQLGLTLFERSRTGLALTSAGREYLVEVREGLSLLANASMHRHRQQHRLLLQVCAPPTFAREVLVPRLMAFTQLEPRVDLEIVLSVPYLGLRPPGSHVEILAQSERPDGAMELLAGDRVTPVCTPAIAAQARLRAPADLAQAALVRCSLEPWRPWFERAGLDWPEPLRGPRLVDMGMAVAAAAGGCGVALVRPSLARPWLERGELVRPFALQAVPSTPYWMRVNESAAGFAPVAAVAEAFEAWMLDVAQG